MLICIEHEKRFINSRPGQTQCDRLTNLHNMSEELLQAKDLWHFDRVSAYFSDASQIFPMNKISLVFFWIGHMMY